MMNESDMTTKIMIIELLEHVADSRVGVRSGFIAVRRGFRYIYVNDLATRTKTFRYT